MGQPHDGSGGPESADPPGPDWGAGADLYGRPLRQIYPPLGYSADGSPQFWPGDARAQTVSTPHAPGQLRDTEPTGLGAAFERGFGQPGPAGQPDPGGHHEPGHTAPPQRHNSSVPTVRSTAITSAVLLAAVIVVLVVAVAFLRHDLGSDNSAATSPNFTTEIKTVPPTGSQRLSPPDRSDAPNDPGSPTGIDPNGKEVVYQVSSEGTATILYVDSMGLRTEFAPQPNWRVTFTGGYNPLRLIVVVGSGSSATCKITVDGQLVVDDEVGPSSTKHSASCVA